MAEPAPARPARRTAGAGTSPERRGSRWYELLLAAILVAALAAAVVAVALWSRGAGDWRGEAVGDVFLAAMLAIAALAAVVFLVYLLTRIPARPARGETRGAEDGFESPAAVRLLGLVLPLVLLLIAAWVYAPPALAHALAAHLLYPAGFALALVLLFDKATRAWTVKRGAVSFREWLYCDAFVILLVVGYLNLMANAAPEGYGALFWDALHVTLFAFVFWLVDRKLTRLRWLVGLAYLTLLPVLLWLWRLAAAVDAAAAASDGAAPAADPSWWSTPWPFIVLGLAACVIEIIGLVAAGRGEDEPREGTAGHVVKDAVFFILYGGLLIAAAP